MRAMLLPFLALLVSGCGGDGTASAEAEVMGMFDDPGSVEFRDVRAGLNGAVCGKVNGKKLGDFTGFHRFVFRPDTHTAKIEPDVMSTTEQDEAIAQCRASSSDAGSSCTGVEAATRQISERTAFMKDQTLNCD